MFHAWQTTHKLDGYTSATGQKKSAASFTALSSLTDKGAYPLLFGALHSTQQGTAGVKQVHMQKVTGWVEHGEL